MDDYNCRTNIKVMTLFIIELLTGGHSRDLHPYYGHPY